MIELPPRLLRRLPLALSLLLNAGLLAGAASRFFCPPISVEPALSVSPVPAVSVVPAAPFHWSQIESDDYQTYIRNLRGIGCPEETIRDIIRADVAALYEGKAAEVKAGTLPATATGPRRSQRIEDRSHEQAALLAALLPKAVPASPLRNTAGVAEPHGDTREPAGGKTTGSSTGTTILSGSLSGQTTGAAVLPAAMTHVLSFLMDNTQQQALAKLQQDFVDAIGGPDQNPADPQYLARWQEAQWLADQRFRAMYGAQAFAERQKQAALESQQQQQQVQ